jgi:uncharacterized protein (DUF983 family)
MNEVIKNRNVFSAMVHFKCPRCRKGNLFLYSNPYNINKLTKMPVSCPVCDQPYEPEPGFYYGAMYVSYFLCVCVFFINFFTFGVHYNFSVLEFALIYSVQILAVMPYIFRYARVLYIYMFVRFDPQS